MRAIQVDESGGPETLVFRDDLPEPGMEPDSVRVRVAAAGVNFIDTYQRAGAYPVEHPWVPGLEGAGVVEEVGPEVTGVSAGDTVAWAHVPGSYADVVVAPADEVVAAPDGVDARTAAALMLQGITAQYLCTTTFRLMEGHTALVYAAAGGVGHLLTQLAARTGARIIATASSEEKAELARRSGAGDVIRYRDVDIAEAVRELTGGEGVDVVYDSVGADTFAASLDCLKRRGTMILYGQSSGAVDPVSPQTLAAKGSLFLTRPRLADHLTSRDELEERAGALLGAVAQGSLEVRIDRTFPLDAAADAHRYLEAGRTTGKLLLEP